MTPRHAQLLSGLVREYIRAGEPVGSNDLIDALSLTFSPATVRHLLHDLEDGGYLEQPHTSAGRVPTDLGYRFYVDRLRPRSIQIQRSEESAPRVVRRLAKASRAVAVTGLPDGRVEHAGLYEFMQQPDARAGQAAMEISWLLDNIHECLDRLSEAATSSVIIYIGSENELLPTQHVSLMVRAATTPDRRRALVLVVGDRRMPYAQTLSLLNQISRIL